MFLAVIILAQATSRFESIALSILILIYVMIQREGKSTHNELLSIAFGLHHEFTKLFRKIGRDQFLWEEAQTEAYITRLAEIRLFRKIGLDESWLKKETLAREFARLWVNPGLIVYANKPSVIRTVIIQTSLGLTWLVAMGRLLWVIVYP